MSIAFLKDWKTSNGKLRAIPHLSTKNESFLRTAQLLKKMGIQNYAFPLCLYDPDLKDVDVHALDEDTQENEILRTKVQIEANRNVWYYLRECIRIYEQGGEPVRFRLNRGSCAMTWLFINGIDSCNLQPRQQGKFTVLSSLIKIPGGWVKNGDLKLGQLVSMPDGSYAPVIGIYPQGEQDIYRVRFEDGRFVDCGLEHLWKVHWPHWGEEDGNKWRVMTTQEIMDFIVAHRKSKNRLMVPLIEPEIMDDIELPIDPYVLGVLLGDGTLTNCGNIVCKSDQSIKDELDRILHPYYKTSSWYADNKSYAIIAQNGNEHIKYKLERLGLLGTYFDTKFIPEIYMHASSRQRLALIQGLMDTNVIIDNPTLSKDKAFLKNNEFEYSTTSRVLAEQFQYLIRSLGGLCKILPKQTYYIYNGEKRKDKVSYRVKSRVKDRRSFFRLSKKEDLTLVSEYKYQDSLKLAIRSIEFVGRDECQCIEVGHHDHLYITNDFIVTHNTVAALSLTSWVLYSSGLEYQIGMMAKDDKLRQENVKRVKSFAENLPKWWIIKDRNEDKNNSEEIYYHALKTHYTTLVGQKEKAAADKQGRGASSPMFHFDEFEFIDNIGTSYPVILASTATARENARKNNKPHSNIITTTAGDPARESCKQAVKILDGAMPFSEQLYDVKSKEDLHQIVEAASPQKMVMCIFSHLQLGKTNEWLRQVVTRNRNTREEILRDYLNRRVTIGDDPIIPKNILDDITASESEIKYVQILSNKFVINWYLPKSEVESPQFKQRSIIVGCDSSEMIDNDATTLVGVCPETLKTVFTFRCFEGNINVVGVMIAQLLLMYPKMIFVPENKSSGTSIIDTVSLILRNEGHNPFNRIFNWVVQRLHEEEFRDINIRDTSLLDTKIKRYFGIKTDKSKRDELYSSVLLQACEKARHHVYDKTLIQELSSLTNRNGRVDHSSGGHDDLTIAWLMCFFLIFHGKHLDVYGIRPGSLLSYVDVQNPSKSKLNELHQEKVKARIEDLEKLLKLQTDVSVKKMIEADIALYKSMLSSNDVSLPSVADDLLRDPKKFTNRQIAEASRQTVSSEDVERSVKMILRL